jgi:hypothetical protein
MATKTSIEKYLENKFVKWCKENNIRAFKGPSSVYAGIPDRIVIVPNGGTLWVEFKGGSYYQLTPIQLKWKTFLVASDPYRYFCVNTKEELEELMKLCLYIKKGLPIYRPTIFIET